MITQLVTPLIDYPEACSVEVVHLAESARFIVRVAAEDLERFTGRNERTGRSLGIIVSAVGSKTGRRFSLAFSKESAAGGRAEEPLAKDVRR